MRGDKSHKIPFSSLKAPLNRFTADCSVIAVCQLLYVAQGNVLL